MPSQPDPNSPFMAPRVESALGIQAGPGAPTAGAGTPGPTASSVSFPAPPAVNSAPPGRPAAATAPTPMGAPAATPAAKVTPTATVAAPAGASAGPTTGLPAAPVAPAPHVVPTTNAFNEPQLSMTPEGAQRYREVAVQTRERLGPVPHVFRHADLPELPVTPGQWNYNPFTGQFTK